MDTKSSNWEDFFKNSSSYMLEDALPYLPNRLKKAAALYIKVNELQNIATKFDQEETLSACGFENHPESLEMILSAMRLRAPKETAAQIDQILQLMKTFKIYQSYQDFLKQNPEANPTSNQSEETNMNLWNENPKFEQIDKKKLQILQQIIEQSKGKSMEEILPNIMSLSSKLQAEGLSFTKEETNYFIEAIKESMTKEEQQRLDMIRNLIL